MSEVVEHWNNVYRTKAVTEVSWYQPRPERSLACIAAVERATTGSVIDVGGGASFLVDGLLAQGREDVAVLDVSDVGLRHARERLGRLGARVTWVNADITRWKPPRTWDIWHDRAVFHFLVSEADRRAYLDALARGTHPGSGVVIAAFAQDGPETCSGLPVARYSAEDLARQLGSGYQLLQSEQEHHRTPRGLDQAFTFALFRRR